MAEFEKYNFTLVFYVDENVFQMKFMISKFFIKIFKEIPLYFFELFVN